LGNPALEQFVKDVHTAQQSNLFEICSRNAFKASFFTTVGVNLSQTYETKKKQIQFKQHKNMQQFYLLLLW